MSRLMLPGGTKRTEPDPLAGAASSPRHAWLTNAWHLLNAPIVIVLLSAFGAYFVFDGIEERSFRRNELFKGCLQRILDAQREVARVRADVELAFRSARTEEGYGSIRISEARREGQTSIAAELTDQILHSPALETLRRSQVELKAIGDSIGALPEDHTAKATAAYTDRLRSFLECTEDPEGLGTCARSHGDLVTLVQEIATTYSARADELLMQDAR